MIDKPTSGVTDRVLLILLLLLALLATSTVARADCSEATILKHHDGTMEYGVRWQVLQTPDWGSFAEGLEGPGEVCAVAMYLCNGPSGMSIAVPDVYVWSSDGVNPDQVLAVVTGVFLGVPPYFPSFGRYEVEIRTHVGAHFWVGIWPYYGDDAYFLGTDDDGPQGLSSTKVPPGYPGISEGWHDIHDVWPEDHHSLGLEALFVAGPTPTRESSWGQVKSLYR